MKTLFIATCVAVVFGLLLLGWAMVRCAKQADERMRELDRLPDDEFWPLVDEDGEWRG